MSRAASELHLRFSGQPGELSDSIPASALARALDGLQRVVHLIGMRLEGRSLGRRARPSQEIQQRFVLVCEVPREGSYHQPVRLVSLAGAQLLTDQDLERAGQELERFLSAVGDADEGRLEEAVADATYRRFMLDALAEAVPDPRTGIVLEIGANGRRLLQSTYAHGFLERQRRPRLSTPSAGVVNGELIEIDFAKRRITLRLLGIRRDITCSYEDTVEPTLLEHPRELIQVFGSVALDAEGIPKTIETVEYIRPIMESEELPVEPFVVQDMKVRPRQPVKIMIAFDREEQLFTAKVPELGIEAAAQTRDEVVDAVTAELRVLWRKYALEDDARLSEGARRLKEHLRTTFEEGRNAA
jgi:hypothetical protein